jgi:hypothetical protein
MILSVGWDHYKGKSAPSSRRPRILLPSRKAPVTSLFFGVVGMTMMGIRQVLVSVHLSFVFVPVRVRSNRGFSLIVRVMVMCIVVGMRVLMIDRFMNVDMRMLLIEQQRRAQDHQRN